MIRFSPSNEVQSLSTTQIRTAGFRSEAEEHGGVELPCECAGRKGL